MNRRLPTIAVVSDHRRVGRALKRYSVSDREFSVSLPERRYELAGEILVDSLAQVGADQGGGPPADVSPGQEGAT